MKLKRRHDEASPAEQGKAGSTSGLNRRNALRAVCGGVVAAMGASVVALPKEASADTGSFTANGNTDALFVQNLGSGPAILAWANSHTNAAVDASNTTSGPAVRGSTDSGGSGPGVVGSAASDSNPGVLGENSGSASAVRGENTGSGVGVRGTANSAAAGVQGENTGSGIGVRGTASGAAAAVQGENTGTGHGVRGTANSDSSNAVRGDNSGSGAAVRGNNTGGGSGVKGTATSDSHAGVEGSNNGAGQGVIGTNAGSGPGVVGSNTGNGVGVSGISNSASPAIQGLNASTGIGVYGNTDYIHSAAIHGLHGGGGDAGFFDGNATVTGTLTVLGAKSAAVKGADGNLRRLYSLECPESWFEDFGSGQLVAGSATVAFAADFSAVIHTDAYHVFPVAKGDCKGLFVTNQTSSGFTIRELQGGTSNVGFDYRVVAKRKDIAGARLESVVAPTERVLPIGPQLPRPGADS